MKILIAIIALAAGLGMLREAQAQKVIKDAAGDIFIDVQDMSAGTFSTTSLIKIATSLNADVGNNVYKRLQYAKADLPTALTWAEAVGLSIGTPNYNEVLAQGQDQGQVQTGCVTYSAEGNAGQWRVPTQREMYLITVMYDALVRAGASPMARNSGVLTMEGEYQTASEESNILVYQARYDGYMRAYYRKNTALKVRCVREVD